MTSNLVLAQLGCGYWGPNLLRNFSALPGCTVKYVVDSSAERRAFVEANFPLSRAIESHQIVLEDPDVHGVIISTPAASHFSLAKQVLDAGKHVFVEKPLATKVAEVDELSRRAAGRNLVVMTGHTFVYNSAVRYVKKLIDSGELGDLRYIYSQRLNLGRIRSDIDALWNFAPHDISIIQYWLGDPEPISIGRQGMAYMQDGIDDVVFLSLEYPGKVIANIHVSWLDPQKVRKMIIVGSRKMVVYDDIAENKIAIYDKGIDRRAILGDTDAIIFEDYGKGFLSTSMVSQVAAEARSAGKIIAADPNPRHLVDWRGATVVTPNRAEAFLAAGIASRDANTAPPDDVHLRRAGETLLQRWEAKYVLVTLGEHGMMLFQQNEQPHYIPTKARQVFDVSGAGDTAIALFTLGLVCGATPMEAAEIANHASAVVVSKLGTATVTRNELIANFREDREAE